MPKPEAQVEPKKPEGLPWKYCECGCKGHAVSVGTLQMWIYDDLCDTPTSFKLHRGHGPISLLVSTHGSFEEADLAARKLAQPYFEKMRAQIEAIAHLFQ